MSEREKRLGLSGRPEDSLSLALDAAELNLLPQDLEALRTSERSEPGRRRKGEAVEKRMERILKEMAEEGELSYRWAEEEEDWKGHTDFFIRGKKGREIRIQVKSSAGGAKIFERKRAKERREGSKTARIEVIVAGRGESNAQIKGRVRKILNRR